MANKFKAGDIITFECKGIYKEGVIDHVWYPFHIIESRNLTSKAPCYETFVKEDGVNVIYSVQPHMIKGNENYNYFPMEEGF